MFKPKFLLTAAFFGLLALSGCGSPKTAVNDIPQQTKVELPAPRITIDLVQSGDHYDVKNAGVYLASVPNKDPEDQKAVFLGFNRDNIYIGIVPHNLGQGYILFKDSYYYNAYQIARIGGQVEPIVHDGRALTAISPDGTYAAWLEYSVTNNLIIQNLLDGTEKKFVLPNGYHQFGSMVFSPDSKKLAYAAAVGFPNRELGAIFIVEPAKDSQMFYDKTGSAGTNYFVITGWKNNDTPEYHAVNAGTGDASAQ